MAEDTHQNLLNTSGDASEYMESQILTAKGEVRYIAWNITTILRQDGDKNIGTLNSGEDIIEQGISEQQCMNVSYI